MHPTYNSLRLAKGSHAADSGEGCLLEITSCLFGESWSDSPQCVSKSLAAFGRATNDWFNDEERQLLLPFAVRLGNTNDGNEHERAFAFTDFAVRVATPIALAAAGLDAEAQKLRAFAPITSAAAAAAAATAATAVADAARFASYASYARFGAAAAAARYAASYAASSASYAGVSGAAGYAGSSAASSARFGAGAAGYAMVEASVALLDRLCPPLPSEADVPTLRWDRTAHIVGT